MLEIQKQHHNMFNMKRQTKSKLKLVEVEDNLSLPGIGAPVTDEVLATAATTTTTTAATRERATEATRTLGNICVLCRQKMVAADTCCYRQAVEAVDPPTSSKHESSFLAQSSGYCAKLLAVQLKFELFLERMAFFIGTANETSTFHKRRRRQQQHTKFIHFTKFLLLLQALAAAATTRLSSCRNYNYNNNNYNNKNNQQQQQQQHNQQQQLASKRATSQVQPKRKQHKHYRQWEPLCYKYIHRMMYAYIILNLMLMNVATAAVFEHHDDLADRLEVLRDRIRLERSERAVSQPNQPSQPMRLSRDELPCKSMDIRNTADSVNYLANCTKIEGFLLISLIDAPQIITGTFPLLTEVTEFIIVYRVWGLESLAQLFPNLSVIRGNALFDGYSLTVHSNPNLKYVGLTKLRSITNGLVRIEKNANLCYANTVDWLSIMAENATASDFTVLNGDLSSCEACPVKTRSDDTGISCKQYPNKKSYCWNSNSCQTICPERCRDNCIDENTCCSKSCLGGCVRDSNGNENCIRCRNVSVNNTCVDSCPSNYFRYEQRCVTAEMCLKMGTKFENAELPLVPFQGVCSTKCPLGYEQKNKTCVKCINSCEKECSAALIDSLVRAREFHGCTIINAAKDPLTISIKREGDSHVMEALEYGFSTVHTIRGSLKVHLTYGLTSLRFFQSLREISGDSLQDDLFALYVLENNDLEEIWAPNQTVFIRNGGVFFHFNRRLCVATINTLLPMLASKPPFFNKSDVATDSNGNRGTCGTSPLQARVLLVSSSMATVWVNKDMISEGEKENSTATIVFKDPRAFIGFQFLHALDPYGNITKSSDQPCDDTWTVSAPTKDGHYLFDNLRPYTNYAFYVRTMAISSETTNGQSDIIRFRTDPSQPSQVRNVEAVSNSDTTIDITWNPPSFPYGEMSHYEVVIKLINDTNENLTRNYCKDPITKYTDDDPKPKPAMPEKVLDPDNAKCDCENKRKGGGAQEYDDRKIHVGIEFENALQNFIYVSKSKSSEKRAPKGPVSDMAALESNAIGGNDKAVRRKREIDLELEEEMMDVHSSFLLRHVRSTRKKFFPTDTKKAHNETTKMSANKNFYEIFVGKVPANQTSFTFQKLHHFTQYEIYVYACRKEMTEKNESEALCSHANEIYWKTKKKDDADTVTDLRVELGNANNTRPAVKLFWKPPADPNGQIISYDLEYTLVGETQVQTQCIPASEYGNLTEGYELKLTEGEYRFRVRANTFAGYGTYTGFENQVVPSPQSFVKHLIWILCLIVGVVCIALVVALRSLRAKKSPNELHINTEVNPFYHSMQYVPDSWEVSRESILQLSPLGQGSFGMVYEGILKASDGTDRECAIKTVNEHATDRERSNFLSEASVMKEFDTNHVVRLLGVCSRGQPALVVMELMKKGDLKSYLRAHRPEERDEAMMTYLQRIGVTGNVQPPTYGRIYRMAMEIADGMAYLAAKKFVHRDLAARNCMVADDLTVKIGDFGMTRDVYETDYYRKGTKGLLPVRWMAPESLRDGVYSSASDVFSFGVVLWEMATLAAQPYQGLSNEQVLRFVIDGGVMERPENCPDLLHRLMERCWRHRYSARPSFMDIIGYLENHCTESDFKTVSFYHSPAGQAHREKEQKERSQMDALAAVPIDQDQQDGDQQEDATTPLRVGDFQDFKSNMEHNSSLDQPAESPIAMVNDNSTHSPFSLNSRFISSSTPDGQTVMPTAFQNLPASQGDDAAPYVLPDTDALGEERAYEIYDPSPVGYNDLPTSRSGSTGGGGGKLSGEQNLLPKKYRQPVVVMSSSVPDDVIGGSSLQPSTASAASSNASSHTGRYPSLKRVVADTFRNKANMLNRHLFNHKRTGSNASHKSNASNAPSTSSNSNLTSYPVAMGNLGTIESGGSGSAGSYTGTPRFYTPMATPVGGGLAISDNPNYKLLDESMGSEQATVLTTSSPNPNYEMMHPTESLISDNPNYVAMAEPPVQMAGVTISHNPNYQPMQAPLHNRQTSSDEDNEDEEEEEDDEDEDVHVEHIKMERMPLSRPTSQRTNYSRTPGSRSRSSSQTRRSPTNPNSGSQAGASANNIRKENWLRQTSSARPPPPNGFIGREA